MKNTALTPNVRYFVAAALAISCNLIFKGNGHSYYSLFMNVMQSLWFIRLSCLSVMDSQRVLRDDSSNSVLEPPQPIPSWA